MSGDNYTGYIQVQYCNTCDDNQYQGCELQQLICGQHIHALLQILHCCDGSEANKYLINLLFTLHKPITHSLH